MSAPVHDQETRDLVSKDGLRKTLFVEAGAGTGKTTQLVGRITNLVLEADVKLSNIAAITFTEAAAAELRTRIRVAFEKAAETATDEAMRDRCAQAIADADLAAISTLHGFASRILGEFAVAADLPPRVRVLDEISSQLAHEDRWSRFVDRLYDDPENEDLLVRAALVNVALEPEYRNHATMKDVAAEFNQNWDRIESLAKMEPEPLAPIDFSELEQAAEAVYALPDQCTDPADKFRLHLLDKLIPKVRAVMDLPDPNRKLAVLAGKEMWGPGGGGKKDSWGGDVVGAKDLVRELAAARKRLTDDAANEVIRALVIRMAGETTAAAASRRRDGGLEFHDLLVLARDVLRKSEEVRRTLHDRFTHLLLDEFQDTDPIQIELAMLIAATVAEGERPGPWTNLSVAEGRLFFVGDPKQSIYRFRRADIELFLAARDRFGPDGSWARLSTNFRTVAPILDWVNVLFTSVMPLEEAGRQPRYEPLVAFRDVDEEADHRPILLGGPHPDPKVKSGELREAEADDVARTVRDIREYPESWPVKDEETGQWRDARLADVTILVPTRTSLPFLRRALDAEDLPYRLATGTLVYDMQEIRDALSALRAIDDPTDQVSLVAALRSPLYACSDVDLFRYRYAGGQWDVRTTAPEQLLDTHPVVAGIAHLRTLWEQRWWLSPSELLERLLRERQAAMLAFGDARPFDVWRRLRFLVDQARLFEEVSGGDLRAFIEWSELQGSDSARVHEPLLPETDDDAVRILTIHGSKGLEFPITILSGMTTTMGRQRAGVSVLWAEDEPLEVKLSSKVKTANHEPRADLEQEMDAYERQRLLYVATTRAKDHLVVSAHHKAGKITDTYGGQVWAFFAEHPEFSRSLDDVSGARLGNAGAQLQLMLDPPLAPSATATLPLDARLAAETALDRALSDRQQWESERSAQLRERSNVRVQSATAIARAADPTIVEEDSPVELDELAGDVARLGESDTIGASSNDSVGSSAEAPQPRRKGRKGSAIGRAVHGVLEHLDFADPHDLDAHVRRQCDLETIPELANTVAALVRSGLASDSIALAIAHPHHRELFVAAPVGSRGIEGYVDLLIEGPDGLIVVDYKTDSARSEAEVDAKLAGYALQGASYAVALEQATGMPVVDCRFVFLRTAGAIERSVENLEGAKAQVRSTLDAPPLAGSAPN